MATNINLFIDTDVILDFLTNRQPFADDTAIMLMLSEQNRVSLFTSSIVIANVYYISRKLAGDKKARSLITEVLSYFELLSCTKPEVQYALKSKFKDFEDALQHSTALSSKKIQAIVTRNTKDYRRSEIAVLTPTELIKQFEP